MTIKLLPCPFCGGTAFMYPKHPVVECGGCGARMMDSDIDTAIAKWNIRTVASAEPVTPDQQKVVKDMIAGLTAQVMRLSAEVEILKGRLQ